MLVVLVMVGACLPDDPPVRGTLLYPGVGISNPRFRVMDDEPWVLFDVRTSQAQNDMAAKVDLHLARVSDGFHQLVLADRAARDEWPILTDADRAGFFMIDERPAPELGLSVGTLLRLRLPEGVLESIDDVLSYGMHPDRSWFYYRRYVPGEAMPEMRLRDLSGHDSTLGPAAGPITFFGKDTFYYLSGPDRVLTRVQGIHGTPQPLRPSVSRYWLHDEQRFAVLAVSDEGKVRTRVLDLTTGEERALAVENPCCWLGLDRNTFVYAVEARDGRPAMWHELDLATGASQVLVLPEGMVDVQGIVYRPGRPEAILIDRNRQTALFRTDREGGTLSSATVELLPFPGNAPVFTEDGRYLLYLEVEPPPPPPAIRRSTVGRLMALDASDLLAPGRLVSPAGTTCLLEPRGFVPNIGGPTKVLFWAHFGLGATDLYLADLDTGETQRLAVGVGPMAVLPANRLLGITRVGQDHTGDLVQKDLLSGQELILEHGVVTVITRTDPLLGDIAAFIVKERNNDSPRNGLWSAPLPSFDN